MCGMPQKSTMISAGEPRPFTSRVVRVTAVDMSARAGLKKPSAAVAARTNWRENGRQIRPPLINSMQIEEDLTSDGRWDMSVSPQPLHRCLEWRVGMDLPTSSPDG